MFVMGYAVLWRLFGEEVIRFQHGTVILEFRVLEFAIYPRVTLEQSTLDRVAVENVTWKSGGREYSKRVLVLRSSDGQTYKSRLDLSESTAEELLRFVRAHLDDNSLR